MEVSPGTSGASTGRNRSFPAPKPRSIQSRFILMEAATVFLALFLMAGALGLSVLIDSQIASGVRGLHQQIALHSKIHETFDGTLLSFWRYYSSSDPDLLRQYKNYSNELRQLAQQSIRTAATSTDRQDAKSATQLEIATLDLTDRVVSQAQIEKADLKTLEEIPERELTVRRALSATEQEQFDRLRRATDRLSAYNRVLWVLLLTLGLFPVLVMLWFRRAHRLHVWEPLENLHRMVLEVKRGNLDVKGAAPATVELGSVTTAFLTMAAELRDMRNSLEEKVRLRAMQAEAAQKDLLRAAKLASLGQLVSGVAHEINNPLTSILGFSEIVLANDEISEAVRKQLRTMRDEALRLKHLVANLSQFARRGPQQLHRLDLRTVPDRLLELRSYQLAANNIRLDYRRADRPVWIQGDGDALLQVMLQLVLNAEHAVRDGRGSGHILLTCKTSGAHAEISVADDGCGMSAEMREHIFDPFFTTRPSRHVTGLGLSVCHGIVEQHGGQIVVESELNSGTVVRTRLPLAVKELKAGPEPAGSEGKLDVVGQVLLGPPAGCERILAIDDEADILSLMVEALSSTRAKVVTLQDAAQLEVALKDGPFDAVLCDLKMPGQDGLSVLRELRKQQPELARRFVLMTGNLADADRAVAELEGVPILTKPFTLSRLREILQQLPARTG